MFFSLFSIYGFLFFILSFRLQLTRTRLDIRSTLPIRSLTRGNAEQRVWAQWTSRLWGYTSQVFVYFFCEVFVLLVLFTPNFTTQNLLQITQNLTQNLTQISSGGNRSMHCWKNCTIQDSYVHGQFRDPTGRKKERGGGGDLFSSFINISFPGTFHESGIRMGESATIVHNSITCDAPDVEPDGGCSADLTGYGDFAPVRNNLIENNFFKATTGGFCAYGGSSGGKPYSADAANIRFINNLFEKGDGGKCGFWYLFFF